MEKIGSGRIVTQLSLFPSGVIELKGKMVVGEEWGGGVDGWRWRRRERGGGGGGGGGVRNGVVLNSN